MGGGLFDLIKQTDFERMSVSQKQQLVDQQMQAMRNAPYHQQMMMNNNTGQLGGWQQEQYQNTVNHVEVRLNRIEERLARMSGSSVANHETHIILRELSNGYAVKIGPVERVCEGSDIGGTIIAALAEFRMREQEKNHE